MPLQADRLVEPAKIGTAAAAPDAASARDAARRRYEITLAEARDLPSHRDDGAGELVAGDKRVRRSPARPRRHRELNRAVSILMAVGAADARGRDLDEQLIGTRLGLRHLLNPKVTGAAIDGCPHGQMTRSALATSETVQ
jgi:hypothetical protein